MRLLLVLVCLAVSCTSAYANRAVFTFLKTVTAAQLNDVLDKERADFIKGVTQGPDYKSLPAPTAANDVDLYTVRYYSTRPEMGGKEIMATGLLALPKIPDTSSIPLLAYNHGTVMGKYEVPSYAFRPTNPTGNSHYPQAYENRYMVALFAGNGYAVMEADYPGLGDGANFKEAYFIKQSTAQAIYDLYLDVKKYLAAQNIVPGKFFVGGWSQGALNTTGFLELLEARGVKVEAAFTAANLNDPFAAMNAIVFHPRAADARWLPVLLGLTTFSCENYFGEKGLAKRVINPAYYSDMKSIYDRTYAGQPGLLAIISKWQNLPFTDFLSPAYRDPAVLAQSPYGRCLAAGEAYRQEFKTPLRMYYGALDEVIRPSIALLARDYQRSITDTPDAPSSSNVQAVAVPGAGHRLSLITGSVDAKKWFDSIR